MVYMSMPINEAGFTDLFFHPADYSAGARTSITLFSSLRCQSKAMFMVPLVHIARLGELIQQQKGRLLMVVLVTLIVGIGWTVILTIFLSYTYGAYNFNDLPFTRYPPRVYDALVKALKEVPEYKPERYLFLGAGALIFSVMSFLRYRFTWVAPASYGDDCASGTRDAFDDVYFDCVECQSDYSSDWRGIALSAQQTLFCRDARGLWTCRVRVISGGSNLVSRTRASHAFVVGDMSDQSLATRAVRGAFWTGGGLGVHLIVTLIFFRILNLEDMGYFIWAQRVLVLFQMVGVLGSKRRADKISRCLADPFFLCFLGLSFCGDRAFCRVYSE